MTITFEGIDDIRCCDKHYLTEQLNSAMVSTFLKEFFLLILFFQGIFRFTEKIEMILQRFPLYCHSPVFYYKSLLLTISYNLLHLLLGTFIDILLSTKVLVYLDFLFLFQYIPISCHVPSGSSVL
jgi:hypothetical protein